MKAFFKIMVLVTIFTVMLSSACFAREWKWATKNYDTGVEFYVDMDTMWLTSDEMEGGADVKVCFPESGRFIICRYLFLNYRKDFLVEFTDGKSYDAKGRLVDPNVPPLSERVSIWDPAANIGRWISDNCDAGVKPKY